MLMVMLGGIDQGRDRGNLEGLRVSQDGHQVLVRNRCVHDLFSNFPSFGNIGRIYTLKKTLVKVFRRYLPKILIIRLNILQIPLNFPVGDADPVLVPLRQLGALEGFVSHRAERVLHHFILFQLIHRLFK